MLKSWFYAYFGYERMAPAVSASTLRICWSRVCMSSVNLHLDKLAGLLDAINLGCTVAELYRGWIRTSTIFFNIFISWSRDPISRNKLGSRYWMLGSRYLEIRIKSGYWGNYHQMTISRSRESDLKISTRWSQDPDLLYTAISRSWHPISRSRLTILKIPKQDIEIPTSYLEIPR